MISKEAWARQVEPKFFDLPRKPDGSIHETIDGVESVYIPKFRIKQTFNWTLYREIVFQKALQSCP